MSEDPTVSQYRAGYARGAEVERVRIRAELLREFGPNRRINNVLGQRRVLVVVLDETCPEEG